MNNLFICRYFEPNTERDKELQRCLNINLQLKDTHVHILNDEPNRHTYNDIFEYINTKSGPDDINIIANSDIYFLDADIALMQNIKPDECYALTRYDVQADGSAIFLNRVDSQDCWVFKGPIKAIKADWFLGRPGCDNRLAFELQQAGYQVLNPSLTIKSYHIHLSQVKSYNKTPMHVVPPPYVRLT